MQQPKYNTLAIVSLLMAFIFSPLAIILGIIALTQIRKTHEKGKPLAIAAIVVSVGVPLILFLLVWPVFLGGFSG